MIHTSVCTHIDHDAHSRNFVQRFLLPPRGHMDPYDTKRRLVGPVTMEPKKTGRSRRSEIVGGNLLQRGWNIVETSVRFSRGDLAEGSSHAAVPHRPDLPREHGTREVPCKFFIFQSSTERNIEPVLPPFSVTRSILIEVRDSQYVRKN